jgi:glycosyltransferase involved in cell wall biosynthesis
MAHILILSSNVVGLSMAGPAIRCWEISKALACHHQVVLVAPNIPDKEGEGFTFISKSDASYEMHFKTADILLVQFVTISLALAAKKCGIKIIIDAYDPLPLESLELFKQSPLSFRYEHQFSSVSQLNFSFQMADGIICASEKQRDLWIGYLLSQKIITPILYDQDTSLRHFIDVVPFGLSRTPPQKTGMGIREQYGWKSTDKILIWGGGIWNWFDPLSLIRAMHLLKERKDIKLLFMGIKNPDPSVPDMIVCHQTIELAKELGLINHTVFFNYGWTPYEDRQNTLLEATIGVSTHLDHIETRYAFRTRILDYIWAKLPILATKGDSFAELIEQNQLGYVVPYQNPESLAAAILSLIDDEKKIMVMQANLQRMQKEFYWDVAVESIERMVQSFAVASRSSLQWKDIIRSMHFFITQLQDKGIKKTLRFVFQKIKSTFEAFYSKASKGRFFK